MDRAFGKTRWFVPDGYLSPESKGTLVSHEAVCVLNTGDQDAHLRLTIYFEDREPIRDVAVTVPAERTRHIRLDLPDQLGGAVIPRGVPYAYTVESDVPVIVQHSRLDTTQEALTLFTTIAYAE